MSYAVAVHPQHGLPRVRAVEQLLRHRPDLRLRLLDAYVRLNSAVVHETRELREAACVRFGEDLVEEYKAVQARAVVQCMGGG